MLGKAKDIRTIEFENYFKKDNLKRIRVSVFEQINEWCEKNPDAEILDIKYSTHSEGDFYLGEYEGRGDFEGYYCALLIYKIERR